MRLRPRSDLSVFILIRFTHRNGAMYSSSFTLLLFQIKTNIFQSVFISAPDCLFLQTRLARLVAVSAFNSIFFGFLITDLRFCLAPF